MTAARASRSEGRLPLVVAVTGHRDPHATAVPLLVAAVREVFESLRRQFPHSPVIALSGMADGADRVAAAAALAAGAVLVAVLPRPREAYRRELSSDQSRGEFDRMISQAACVIDLPATPADAHDSAPYVALANFLSLHAHAVVAMWDGRPGAGPGGTEHVARMCLNGFLPADPAAQSPLDAVEKRPVWWINTRRADHPEMTDPSGVTRQMLPGHETEWKSACAAYDKILRDTDAFNRDAATLGGLLNPSEEQCLEWLAPAGVRSRWSPALQSIARAFARADALAIHFQQRLRAMLRLVLIFVFAAACCAQLRNWPGVEHWLGGWVATMARWGYMLLLLAAAVCYAWERLGKFHTRYLDYRALAEGLRVQLYWRLAGLGLCVADHYLRRQRGELEWIRRAIRAAAMQCECAAEGLAPRVDDVLAHWVIEQNRFFTARALQQGRGARRVSLLWNAAVVAGLLAAIASGFGAGSRPTLRMAVAASGILLVAAGLLKIRSKILALSEQSKQYSRMADAFSLAESKLRVSPGDPAIIEELGREALAENADWLLLHRQRPLELPRA